MWVDSRGGKSLRNALGITSYSSRDLKIHTLMENEARKAHGGAAMVDQYIVTGGQDQMVTMWNLSTGERVRDLTGHQRE
eukprot:scaffold650678_cov50-Prasinocladus_malaysianus.AAC.1